MNKFLLMIMDLTVISLASERHLVLLQTFITEDPY